VTVCTDGQSNTNAVILTTKESLTACNFDAAVKGNRAVKEVTVKDDGDFEGLWM